MIDKRTAVQAIRKELAGQANYEKFREDKERLAAITRSLAERAESEQHANAMLRAWAQISEFIPTPADIFAMAGRVADPAAPVLPDGCDECRSAAGGYHAFISVERPDGYSGAGRCSCARGRALQAMDVQRKQQTTEPLVRPQRGFERPNAQELERAVSR